MTNLDPLFRRAGVSGGTPEQDSVMVPTQPQPPFGVWRSHTEVTHLELRSKRPTTSFAFAHPPTDRVFGESGLARTWPKRGAGLPGGGLQTSTRCQTPRRGRKGRDAGLRLIHMADLRYYDAAGSGMVSRLEAGDQFRRSLAQRSSIFVPVAIVLSVLVRRAPRPAFARRPRRGAEPDGAPLARRTATSQPSEPSTGKLAVVSVPNPGRALSDTRRPRYSAGAAARHVL